MVQLNRSMMERYEITEHRPEEIRAVLFGADWLMLGAAARLLDAAGVGALCVTRSAQALRAQDGMFTLLVRGDREDGDGFREEKVVQSILDAADPDGDFDALMGHAENPRIEMLFLPADCDGVKIAVCARFLFQRMRNGLAAPAVLLVGGAFAPDCAAAIREAVCALARGWSGGEGFASWLPEQNFICLLAETLCGPVNDAERAKALHDMNYRDDFIAWAEPQLKCTPSAPLPASIAGACEAGGFETACLKKERIFDTLVFLCAAVGHMSGMDSFAQTLKDERLRAWIGRAFFDEILPGLPWKRAEITADVISAFSRLENSMNDVPLLELGGGMLHTLPRTLLPAVRNWAEREFEAPPRLSLALSAAIMLYAGARRNEKGEYEILRGEGRFRLKDDEEILSAFSSLSHDMPAESLAYAVLADRDIWGADLREIDGLEMRVAFDLSSIQRIGLRETMKVLSED